MALYVPLDVDFATDPKFLAAGPVAGYVFICSLALSKRAMLDGKIATEQLAAIAIGIPNPERHAQKLVDVGLWTALEDGWLITSWSKRNKSRAEIEAAKEKKRLAAVKANHTRWHAVEPSDECPFCDPNRIGTPIQSRLQVEPKAEPEPKEEAATEPDALDPVDAETARRVAVRRSNGEEIGIGLVRLIRQDVVNEFSALEAMANEGRCAHCEGLFVTGTGWAHELDCPSLDPAEVSA